MTQPGLRRVGRAARARLIYRLDSFLSYPPVAQLAFIVLITLAMVILWAAAARWADPSTGTPWAALWWSLTHFFDGGTLANDTPPRLRLVGVGATASGIVVLSLLTAAFASKMAERIGDLRTGLNPVVERGHLLVLGFDSKVVLLAREIARSRQRRTLVVLAPEDKDRMESALKLAARVRGARLRVVVRRGDPRLEPALLRVAADRAGAILVVPPAALGDEDSVHWTLGCLLAVRRVVDEGFRGQVVVDARRAEAKAVLSLAAEPGVAGAGALATEIVASDDVLARVLAQSVRHEGVYFALREMLSFNDCEIYLEPLPTALEGQTFDAAHARVTNAVLVGTRAADGRLVLAPERGDPRTLARGDVLVVLAARRGAFRLGGAPVELREPATDRGAENRVTRSVTLLGYNRTLPLVLEELASVLGPGSSVRVACGDAADEARAAVAALALEAGAAGTSVACDPRSPTELARSGDDAVFGADTVVVLGCEQDGGDAGDARALATLLWLRHGERATGRSVRRAITEVRDPRASVHVAQTPGDFVVSGDVVAMLLAQVALDPDVAPVYREILSPAGAEIYIRPRRAYVASSDARFGEVMAAARARGEVAIGLYPCAPQDVRPRDSMIAALDDDDEDEGRGAGAATPNPLWLNPPRDARVPDEADSCVVVLARPRA